MKKKEKKKGSCLKTILVAFGILIVLAVIGSVFGNDDKENNSDTQGVESPEIEVPIKDANKEPEVSKESISNASEATPDSPPESETENGEPLGFNVDFSKTYRNDVTGNWRLARIAENIDIEEYALDYYKNYFEADNEIHIIINFSLNTTTRIMVMGNLLDVATMEYVEKEEHDAALACSGMLLNEYHISIDTGEIEKIQ